MKRIVLFLLIALSISCQQKKEGQLTRITIAQTSDFFLYAPLYIAKDAKIFEKEGLDVTILNTGGDEKTWASVVSGDASFGISDPTFVIFSDQRGQSGKVIANIVNGVPFWGITFNNSISPFKELTELENYTIGTFPAPSTAYSLQKKMFLDLNLTVRIREGAFGTMIPMLRANQVDIALELEPNVSQALRDGARIVYSLSEIYGDFAVTGLTTTDKIIRENPDLVQSVVRCFQLSLDFIHDNPDSTLYLLNRRFTDIEKDVAREALQRAISDKIIPKTTFTYEHAWDKAVQLRKDIGDLKDVKEFNYYIDNSFSK